MDNGILNNGAPQGALNIDPMDLSAKYNTALSPEEEQAFMKWAAQNNRANDTYDYDLRGAWKELNSGAMKQADNGHLGDKYKKPNHPTFSDQSIYHGVDGHSGGSWIDGGDQGFSFKPGATNMWDPQQLQQYFSDVEPGVKLVR